MLPGQTFPMQNGTGESWGKRPSANQPRFSSPHIPPQPKTALVGSESPRPGSSITSSSTGRSVTNGYEDGIENARGTAKEGVEGVDLQPQKVIFLAVLEPFLRKLIKGGGRFFDNPNNGSPDPQGTTLHTSSEKKTGICADRIAANVTSTLERRSGKSLGDT